MHSHIFALTLTARHLTSFLVSYSFLTVCLPLAGATTTSLSLSLFLSFIVRHNLLSASLSDLHSSPSVHFCFYSSLLGISHISLSRVSLSLVTSLKASFRASFFSCNLFCSTSHIITPSLLLGLSPCLVVPHLLTSNSVCLYFLSVYCSYVCLRRPCISLLSFVSFF